MSVDTKHELLHVSRLANPSRMQAARWGGASVDTKHELLHVSRLANPSRMQAARWAEWKDNFKTVVPDERSDSQGSNFGIGWE